MLRLQLKLVESALLPVIFEISEQSLWKANENELLIICQSLQRWIDDLGSAADGILDIFTCEAYGALYYISDK